MRYRKVDDNGDMLPCVGESAFATGSDAAMYAVQSRLRLLLGEWWQDENAGFEVPNFLFDGTRMALGPQLLTTYIQSYIEQTEGVTSAEVTAEQKDRKLMVSAEIRTEYGTSQEELTDELLRAVY